MESIFPGELIEQNDRHPSISTLMTEKLNAHEDLLQATS